MKRTTTALALMCLMGTDVWAFDFGSIISETVKNVATSVAKDSAKSVARSQGIEGADQLIDAAAAARTAPGTINQAQALKGIANSGPLGAASAALAARDMAQRATDGRPDGRYRAEYLAIQQGMSACKDVACIRTYQQRMQALQQTAVQYQANTGDANFDGKVDAYDARQAQVNAAMAKLNSCASYDQQCRKTALIQLQLASGQTPGNAPAGNAAGDAISKGIGGAVGNLIGSFGFGK